MAMQNLIERTGTLWAICVTSVVIPSIEYLYGSHILTKPLLVIFTTLIILDWLAGRRVATKTGTKASKYGLDGAVRTIVLYVLLGLGHFVDEAIGFEYPIAYAVSFALVAIPTAESFVANSIIVGWDSHIKVSWLRKLVDFFANFVETEIEYKTARIEERQKQKHGDNRGATTKEQVEEVLKHKDA